MKGSVRCPGCGAQVPVYRNPFPTVDAIVRTPAGVVFIERRNPPHGWALPGGFVDYGESLEEAVVREVKEETALDLVELHQFHAYSDPDRDPRQHNISVVFIGRAEGEPRAGDDAGGIGVFPPQSPPDPLVFDHPRIIEDFLRFLETGRPPDR